MTKIMKFHPMNFHLFSCRFSNILVFWKVILKTHYSKSLKINYTYAKHTRTRSVLKSHLEVDWTWVGSGSDLGRIWVGSGSDLGRI